MSSLNQNFQKTHGRELNKHSLEVICYSGHTYAERPQSFLWHDTEHKVKTIEKEWREPGKNSFKVITDRGKSFELCYNETNDEWSAVELVV